MMSAASKHNQSGESRGVNQRFSRACEVLSGLPAKLAEEVSLAGTFLIISLSLAGVDVTTLCLSVLTITNQLPVCLFFA
jgi:hypothetical protein